LRIGRRKGRREREEKRERGEVVVVELQSTPNGYLSQDSRHRSTCREKRRLQEKKVNLARGGEEREGS
jgi:hypothetical protein